MTREEAQARYEAFVKEAEEYAGDAAALKKIIADVEDLVNKYADISGGHYNKWFHDRLLKSVGSLIKLQAFFEKKCSLATRAYKKTEFTIMCLDNEARNKARKHS